MVRFDHSEWKDGSQDGLICCKVNKWWIWLTNWTDTMTDWHTDRQNSYLLILLAHVCVGQLNLNIPCDSGIKNDPFAATYIGVGLDLSRYHIFKWCKFLCFSWAMLIYKKIYTRDWLHGFLLRRWWKSTKCTGNAMPKGSWQLGQYVKSREAW